MNSVAPFADEALVRRIEAADCDLLQGAAKVAQAQGRDVFLQPLAGGFAVCCGASSPLNKLAGLGLEGLPDQGQIEEVEASFHRMGCAVQVDVPTLAPAESHAYWPERGYRVANFENVLGLSLEDRKVDGSGGADIEIESIDPAQMDDWLDVIVTGFAHPDTQGLASHESFPPEVLRPIIRDMTQAPNFHLFQARLDGQVAGAGNLRLAGELAQLCGAATLPDFRRRGVQTQLLEGRLDWAAQRGADLATVTTQPGSKSQQNVQRRGFQVLYSRAVYVLSPPESEGS